MSEIRARPDVRIFFWLPKTAGGTLAAGIRSNARVQWLGSQINPDSMPAPSSEQLWLGGHVSFGDHLIHNAEPVYLTVLRDPIERLISEFFYHHQHNLPGIFIPKDEIVPAFIRYVEATPHLNYYCHMFSDYCVEKEIAEEGLPAWDGSAITGFNLIIRRIERYGFLTENVPFHKVNVDEAFLRASKNIVSMRYIGFFDRLYDATKYLRSEFGLNIGLDTRVHQTAWMPGLKDLPPRIGVMLRRKTEADYEFVSRARRAPTAALSPSYRLWRKLARAERGAAQRASGHQR